MTSYVNHAYALIDSPKIKFVGLIELTAGRKAQLLLPRQSLNFHTSGPEPSMVPDPVRTNPLRCSNDIQYLSEYSDGSPIAFRFP